ncbi:MAG: hypothetical protein ACREJO_14660 [Phycisphaerales bacterium]
MPRRARLFDILCISIAAAVVVASALFLRPSERAEPTARSAEASVSPTAEPAPQPDPAPVAPRSALESLTDLVSFSPAQSTVPEVDGRYLQIEPWRRNYYCVADFNKDDVIDRNDLILFLHTYQTRSGPAAEWLDFNHDGVINELDTIEFLNSFLRNDCDPAERAKMRWTAC